MPKELQNKPCRTDTRKHNVTKNSLISKVSKVLGNKIVKKKVVLDNRKKLEKLVNNGEQVKRGRIKAEVSVPIKTRSGACLVINAGKSQKMKEKQKVAEKSKDKGKKKEVKKSSCTAANSFAVKKDGKKSGKNEEEKKKVKNETERRDSLRVEKIEETDATPKKESKKEPKKTKVKKEEDKKEPVKSDKEEKKDKKDDKNEKDKKEVKAKDEKIEKEKKQEYKKKPKKSTDSKEEKITVNESAADKKDTSSQPKKIKFFKSKSKKVEKSDKTKESSKKSDLKDAFSVYDNIDDDSEEPGKNPKKKETLTTKTKVAKIGKETEIKMKQHLEEFKKSKIKSKEKVEEKRKIESDSEVDNKKRKKMRKNVEDEDEEDEPKPKTIKKNKFIIKDDDSTLSPASDVPLNELVAKPAKSVKSKERKNQTLKREAESDDSEVEAKKRPKTDTDSKAKAKKTPEKSTPKKVEKKKDDAKTAKKVRFDKQVTAKTPAKGARRRKQRMASLNAMAMVHCLYENEGKSGVSVSSCESTETSEDNLDIVEIKKKPDSPPKEVKSEIKETALVKFEKNHPQDPDPVINRESLRSAPGLRSVGKHWDMNSSSISSTLSDDNIEIIPPPIVIKEITTLEKPKNALRKKFARALRCQMSDESSEEEKHQALLLEEKKRMVRRRRRQREEIAMDLKDMVVCKRMASLNATAILAASYSSTTGKKTITVKSSGKGEEKSENVENFEKTESVIAKIKSKKLPFIRKKFSSSSDADVEDEADLSSSEVVVKTASSSGKQQVSLIVNQDSGVTITGVYLNSTTKSTHHQGFCSISGMQYRISSTSHTQTEATTVTTEAIIRTPQEPLRPPITVSLHSDRQSPSHVALSANHPSPVKTYTPLGALSNMQPPGSPHHVHHIHHHPKTVTISSTQEISSLERHGCPSAFSAPTVYGPPPPPPPPNVPTRPPYPILSKSPPEAGFVTGYYQPAGPLISHHHHHHHHHHHVQTNTTTTTSTATLPTSTATSTSSSSSTISFAKVSQSPLVQPPTPPASNVTQPVSENSDNEITSATTPATEHVPLSESEPPAYRFGSSANPPFRSPSHTYQTYYPSPPSTASLSHPQQQAHFQEILYSANPPAGPPGPYHLSYLQSKPPYHGPFQRRYIPALPPQQYFHHEYSASGPASNAVQQQVVVPAHSLTSTAESYHSAPSTPTVVESYPPPPPPLYYSGYSSAPPTPYYPYAAASRSLTLVETSCPCPLQGCQKNVHTGPLTGIISKGPVKQHSTPLSPVALSLPKEPQDIRSLPSPARGSAGCRPTPSPAIATAKNPSCWSENADYSYDTTGLLAISKGSDSNDEKQNGRTSRREQKKLKIKKFKTRKTKEEVKAMDYRINGPMYNDVLENSDTVTLISSASLTHVSRVKPSIIEVCETECENIIVEQVEEVKKRRKRKSDEDDMLKSYPVMKHIRSDVVVVDELVKKPKLEEVENEKQVDMEKNNYLSALQLCSVNEIENRSDKESNVCVSEIGPLRRREDEKNVKIQVKKNPENVDASSSCREHVKEQCEEVTTAGGTVPCRTNVEAKKPTRLRRKRWTTKKKNKKKNNKSSKGSEEEKIEAENAEKIRRAELLSLTQKRALCKLKWSNGWSWLGQPFVSKVFLNTEGSEVLRTCYHAMKHQAGDIIKPKDCILLRSGSKKSDLPYVAKVAHLWEDPEDGEMMMSLFWFYRPEHTEHDSIHSESPYELYASKHKDINSVACIEDKCYVLTFNEYCRYHKSIRQNEESVDVSSVIVPPLSNKKYPRHSLLPPENTSLDLVFFCRKIYDFRQHRLLKNPFFV